MGAPGIALLQAATSHAVMLALAIPAARARQVCVNLALDSDRSRLSQSFSRGTYTLGGAFQAKPSGGSCSKQARRRIGPLFRNRHRPAPFSQGVKIVP